MLIRAFERGRGPTSASRVVAIGAVRAWVIGLTVMLLVAGCGDVLSPTAMPEDLNAPVEDTLPDEPKHGDEDVPAETPPDEPPGEEESPPVESPPEDDPPVASPPVGVSGWALQPGDGPRPAEDEAAVIASAAFFVAPWGSDGGAGSLDDPFASLRPVAELAQPGDVVLLRGGVYEKLHQVYYKVSMSGAEGAPIVVRSFPGERAVFDGGRHAWHPRRFEDGRSMTDPMLLQVFGDHLVLEDLTFQNGVGIGLYFIGYNNVVRRVTSRDHHAHGIQFQGSFNLLEFVTVFGNDSVANGGNSANGISLVDGAHIRAIKGDWAETRGNVIRYVLVYRNSDDGIGVWNSWDTLIEYSVAFDNGYGPTGHGVGIKLGGARRPDIGTVARFNIAFGNKYNFHTNTSTGVTLYHNTSWAAGSTGFVLTDHATGADENVAYNNLSYEDTYPRARGDGTDHRSNTWNLGIDAPAILSLDPTSSRFMALASDSPAVDAGMDIGLPFEGTAPDLGALQHGERLQLRF